MPVRLILNADDFGLTPGINRAILSLYRKGALRSATLMATAPYAEEAMGLALAHPGLGVGCHLTFVDGLPAAHPEAIPSLLGADGKTFRPSMLDFVQALLRGTVAAEDVAREAQAQIQLLQRKGMDVTHVDTHKHVHVFPELARTILHVAERCGVRAVRNPFEPRWSSALPSASFGRRMQMRWVERNRYRFLELPPLASQQIQTTEGTLGIAATGILTEDLLRRTLQTMMERGTDETWELCCHPGHVDHQLSRVATRLRESREIEYGALLAVVPEFIRSVGGASLIHYGELGVAGLQRLSGQFVPHTGFETAV